MAGKWRGEIPADSWGWIGDQKRVFLYFWRFRLYQPQILRNKNSVKLLFVMFLDWIFDPLFENHRLFWNIDVWRENANVDSGWALHKLKLGGDFRATSGLLVSWKDWSDLSGCGSALIQSTSKCVPKRRRLSPFRNFTLKWNLRSFYPSKIAFNDCWEPKLNMVFVHKRRLSVELEIPRGRELSR